MPIANEIQQAAIEIANGIHRRIAGLEKEKTRLENELSINQAALDAANLCHDRLGNFRPEIGADYQCPRCWINNESRVALRAAEGTEKVDVLRCPTCHWEILVEF